MKAIAVLLVFVSFLLAASDVMRARGLRFWRANRTQQGMDAIKTAAFLNPLSLDLRLDQIESLFTGYKMTRNADYLKEAELLGRDLVLLYPGSVQARSVYSMTLVFAATHGSDDYYPIAEALRAAELDPVSVAALERAMFLIAAKRGDYGVFKTLGSARGRLTRSGVVMRCALCGRPWLEHR